MFGPKLATKVFNQCRGTEEDPVDFWKTQIRKSVSCDINYGIRFTKVRKYYKNKNVQLKLAERRSVATDDSDWYRVREKIDG